MTTSGGFSFGNALTANTLKLQTPLIATTSVTPSLGGPLLATTSSSAPLATGGGLLSTSATSGFNFKGLTSTTSGTAVGTSTLSAGGLGATTGLTFGSTPSTGISFGANTAATTSVGGFSAQPITTAAASNNIGLGGVNATSTSNKGGGETSDKSNEKTAKSGDVPQEISSTVESFKKYVKEQKAITEEVSRVSSKPMEKVGEETAALKQLVSVISNGIHRNASFVSKLKQESAGELKNAEIAKQTKDLPAGMQYENTVPIEYFQRTVIEFERRMLSYKQQIEELEHHLMSLNHSAPVNPNELTMMIKRIHETFVALAAQLHGFNEGVSVQKEQFLRYRKTTLGDSRDIFAEKLKGVNSSQSKSSRNSAGPSAFSHIPNAAAVAMVSALNRQQQTPAAAPPTHGIGAPGPTFGSTLPVATTTSLFGSVQPSSLFSQNKSFGTTTSGLSFRAAQPTNTVRPLGFGSATPSFGAGQPTSGFGSTFSFGNTSAVRPLGK